MAFEAQQIFPIDFNKSAAVGVNIPFSAPGVFKPNYTTKEAIKSNLINFFLTNQGERPLNPTFGGGLRDFVFEQIVNDNLDSIEELLLIQIVEFFPNINVENLEIFKKEDNNQISISLNYSVLNTNINDNVQIEFN
jgi:phage baseplate assembly protein W